MILFSGLSAFSVTPTDVSDPVDMAALASLLDRIVGAGADSIGLLGSTAAQTLLAGADAFQGDRSFAKTAPSSSMTSACAAVVASSSYLMLAPYSTQASR